MATFSPTQSPAPKPSPSVYEAIRHAHIAPYSACFTGNETAAACIVSARPLTKEARAALVASAKQLGYREQQLAFIVLTGTPQTEAESDSEATPNQPSAPTSSSAEAHTTLQPADLMHIIETLDPLCVVLADHKSTAAASRAYNAPLALEAKEQLLGRPVRCFENFAALLATPEGKRQAWAALKTLPRG